MAGSDFIKRSDPSCINGSLRRKSRPQGQKGKDPVWLHGANLIRAARTRSRQRRTVCDLTNEWVAERLDAGVCEVTGLRLVIGKPGRTALSPSIDKIDPKRGYTQDNCRVVAWIYNAAKMEFGDSDVFNMAIALCRKLELAPLVQHLESQELFV